MGKSSRSAVVRAMKRIKPYAHQSSVIDAFVEEQIRRFYLVWHRRAGKDVFMLDFFNDRMQERVGNYWHLFPFHVQAKRAIWKGIDIRDGVRFIDRAFPNRVKAKDNDTEMSITMPNGSTWQMLGSDNYDRLVGSNPAGVAFSEWALCDPAAWDYIRPILTENKGWVAFITTLRGRNHAYRMLKHLEGMEGWYVDVKTIDETYRHDNKPIVTKEDVERDIREGMNPSLARQEYYCDPDAASTGAIFSRQYNRMLWLPSAQHQLNNRAIRIAWGMKNEGIAAVAFQDHKIIGTHTFLEQNLTDAVQSISRRHPHAPLIHHAVNPDPSLFSVLDGHGVVNAPVTTDEHFMHGRAAAMLNVCEVTASAKERLTDFAMNYAPFRETHGDEDVELTNDALCQALAVMHTAQYLRTVGQRKPLDYSRYDRGII
jgi:hypothetical protein